MKAASTQAPCQAVVKVTQLDQHSLSCQACLQKAQASIAATVVPKDQVIKVVNRSTYTCPICQTPNLPREQLLSHVAQNHHRSSGVCPICITYPHGDPNYVCRDLAGHLSLRHKYDMGEVIENDTDEDAQLRWAMQQSMVTGPNQYTPAAQNVSGIVNGSELV